MKIKRYVVRDMQEGLKLIKEDLGQDAIIISSHRLPRKSFFDFLAPRLLEVTAVLDSPGSKPVKTPDRLEEEDRSARRLVQLIRDRDQAFFSDSKAAQGRETRFDMILKTEGSFLIDREINQQWKKILASLEIHDSIVENLVESIRNMSINPHTLYEDVLAVLKARVAQLLDPLYRPSKPVRIIAFVGPTGGGKTTTLLKLATHYSMYENKKVALVAAGGNGNHPMPVEMLKYFGMMNEVPVEYAASPAELARTLERHADKDLIMVDTMGVPTRSTGMMLRLSSLLDSLGGSREVYLVLSSTTKNVDLLRSAVEFRKVGYSRLIFTRLDETETCGSILNVVLRMGIPVSFVAYGQNIPDDIAAVNAKKLAGLLLGGVDRYVERSLQACL